MGQYTIHMASKKAMDAGRSGRGPGGRKSKSIVNTKHRDFDFLTPQGKISTNNLSLNQSTLLDPPCYLCRSK